MSRRMFGVFLVSSSAEYITDDRFLIQVEDILILTFLELFNTDTSSVGGLVAPEGIIRPVVSVYTFDCHFHIMNLNALSFA